ncbi:hypothetical protein BV898_13367 [Hypsibius exemplaris]|uniref:Uncharacterized protein n=1 Tax=Hypsibius exemplaris TaxID=2072580 RepID=A0A1W0WAV2_HYPEX|nr:hypothetical protein BV898_13367 [Hypsibius exemplaris]
MPLSILRCFQSPTTQNISYTEHKPFQRPSKSCSPSPDTPQDFSIHSFRRGATIFASIVGIFDDLIKAQGTWRSTCDQRVINRDAELREQFAVLLKNAVTASLSCSFGFWVFGVIWPSQRPKFAFGIDNANKDGASVWESRTEG